MWLSLCRSFLFINFTHFISLFRNCAMLQMLDCRFRSFLSLDEHWFFSILFCSVRLNVRCFVCSIVCTMDFNGVRYMRSALFLLFSLIYLILLGFLSVFLYLFVFIYNLFVLVLWILIYFRFFNTMFAI